MIFCTLFDSNYLDKGLVLYKSIKLNTKSFKLYVLAMDDFTERVLNSLEYNHLIVINLKHFIGKMSLSKEFNDRKRAEFCWTCTPFLIDYVINECSEQFCTYVDADMYFYSDPSILLEEMQEKTVQIVEHRFTKSLFDKYAKKSSGNYCVQFNTFKNEEKSIDLLNWWKSKCKESCSQSGINGVMGDQYYLNGWETKDFVSVLQNYGGGVAPWNIGQYKLIGNNNGKLTLKKGKSKFELIFYHFHNLSYLSNNKVNISVYERKLINDSKLINCIYLPYLGELQSAKKYLKKNYNFYPLITEHPGFTKKDKRENSFCKINKSLKRSGLIEFLEKTTLVCRNWIVSHLNAKKDIIQIGDEVKEWSI